MTSRNLSTARSSSRTNTQSLYEARPATIHRPYPNSSAASTSYQSTRRTAAPAPPTEEQRQSGNILRQKALRAGQVHGSSSNLSSSSLSSSRDAKIRANRSNEDSSVGSKARPGKDVSPGIEMGGNRDLGIAFEDNEIVKRDANGEYESFLTVGGQVYEDVNLGGEGMSDGTETSESAKRTLAFLSANWQVYGKSNLHSWQRETESF